MSSTLNDVIKRSDVKVAHVARDVTQVADNPGYFSLCLSSWLPKAPGLASSCLSATLLIVSLGVKTIGMFLITAQYPGVSRNVVSFLWFQIKAIQRQGGKEISDKIRRNV